MRVFTSLEEFDLAAREAWGRAKGSGWTVEINIEEPRAEGYAVAWKPWVNLSLPPGVVKGHQEALGRTPPPEWRVKSADLDRLLARIGPRQPRRLLRIGFVDGQGDVGEWVLTSRAWGGERSGHDLQALVRGLADA